jgi:hypothetical protein
VAVTVTVVEAGSTAGAVYSPPELMVPHDPDAHPVPDTVQFTAVELAPVTTAENCCCPLWPMVAFVGLIAIVILAGVPIVTVAVPNWLRSARDVAVTVTVAGLGATAGAV